MRGRDRHSEPSRQEDRHRRPGADCQQEIGRAGDRVGHESFAAERLDESCRQVKGGEGARERCYRRPSERRPVSSRAAAEERRHALEIVVRPVRVCQEYDANEDGSEHGRCPVSSRRSRWFSLTHGLAVAQFSRVGDDHLFPTG